MKGSVTLVTYYKRYASTLTKFSTRKFKVLDGNFMLSDTEREKCLKVAQQNEDEYEKRMQQVMAGGGSSAIMRHTKKNKKLLPRERIKLLVDQDYPMLEIAPFSGLGMDYGDICSAGNICIIAKISGQLCVIGANDATVKGGTVYPIGVKKQLRMQEVASENHLPCLYLMDSGGGFLPLQSEVFPDKNHGGRVFYNEAIMNSQGIPQICMVAGSCTAGAAYIPTMANEVIMVDKIGTIFLAGPPLVYAAIGQTISDQDLGGAGVHCDISGCADYKAKDELEAIEMTKDVMSTLNMENYLSNHLSHVEETFYNIEELRLLSITRDQSNRLYMKKILARVLDASRFHEYKPTYGKELITGFGRVNGVLVGIIANNGMFTPDSCLKGSNFVYLCNARVIPVVFFQDIQASLNAESETKCIKSQAQLMSSIAVSNIPKITMICGSSFGVGNYSMCGRSMGPRFVFTWPSARVSIENPDSMKLDADIYGDNVSLESSSYYGSSRIWDDGVILPQHTRHVLSLALNACLTHQPVDRAFEQNILRM